MNTEQRDTKHDCVCNLCQQTAFLSIPEFSRWIVNHGCKGAGYISHLNQLEPTAADPKHIPTSFSEWLEQNNDSIDIGGNTIPDRIQANQDRYQ